MRSNLFTCGVLCVLSGTPALAVEADARRGAELFVSQRCVTCHSIGGKRAGGGAPDLGQRTGRDYSPAGLASRMWNHAPAMWSAMRSGSVEIPRLSEQQAADLFIFFYAAKYFDRPGDAARGKRVFEQKGCAECHKISEPGGKGTRVAAWTSLGDPVVLVDSMWNHAGKMLPELKRRKKAFPELSGAEVTDLLVYLQNLPELRRVDVSLTLPSAEGGEQLLESKGCAGCHKGSLDLKSRVADKTLAEVAAAMWNHAPRIANPTAVSEEEMRRIIAYTWSAQFFRPHGDATRGSKVFADKGCSGCHGAGSSGAPDLKASPRPTSPVTLVSVLWRHGPKMYEGMKKKGGDWPRLTASDVGNLTAYLSAPK
jgi:mono/diheme cytochrome c family protein